MDGENDAAASVMSWISWYCKLNDFLVEINVAYIKDDFNLTGLSPMVPHYEQAYYTILDWKEDDSDDTSSLGSTMVADSATLLYGLIHARYILSVSGGLAMAEKYRKKTFGCCPNSACQDTAVMPCGFSDFPGVSSTVVFCPSCQEVYWPSIPQLAELDGAFFGTSFCHQYFMQSEEKIPHLMQSKGYYVPKIFGFKLSPIVRDRALATNEDDSDEEEDNNLVTKSNVLPPPRHGWLYTSKNKN